MVKQTVDTSFLVWYDEEMIETYVVIPFKGKIEMTDALITQLAEQQDAAFVILMNNGEPQRFSWSARYSRGTGVGIQTYNEPGTPLHVMWNKGIAHAVDIAGTTNINVAVLNNDLRLETPNYLECMADALRSDPDVGVVTGMPLEWSFSHDLTGGAVAQGNSMMLRAKLPFRFDERFQWYWGDVDLFAQAENAGYRVVTCAEARHTHLDGGSQTLRELDQDYFRRCIISDLDIFFAKWPQIPLHDREIPRRFLRPRSA